jgi:hypothetical protein
MSVLNLGNVAVAPSSYKGEGQYFESLPGYRFYKAAGYVALKPSIDNRFPIWVPSQEFGKPRKRLQIPAGAQIYHVGIRPGRDVHSEAQQFLTLTLTSGGTPTLANATNICRIGPTASAADATKPWAVLGSGTANTRPIWSRTNLLRTAKASPAFDAAAFDGINAITATAGANEIDEAYRSSGTVYDFEIQCRATAANDGALATIGASTGGLRQAAKYPNEGYILVQLAWYMQTLDVVTDDDFAGVVWEDVFANV